MSNFQPVDTKMFDVFMKELLEAVQPVLENVSAAIKKVYAAIYQDYVDSGAIYGESHEGFMRWLGEISEAASLRAKSDRILEHHQDMKDFKNMLERNRNAEKK